MITSAEVVRYELPFRVEVPAAGGLHRTRRGLLLGLGDEEGRIGWGEAAPLPGWSRDEVGPVEIALRGLAESLAARPRPAAALRPTVAAWLGRLPSAAAALDAALLDLGARREGLSLAERLAGGGPVRRRVAVNALISAPDAGAAAGHASLAYAEGFRTLKLKMASAGRDDDVARVRAVREAVGPECMVRLDAERRWDLDDAIRVLDAVAECGIEYVEDPVDDLDTFVQLAAATDVPLAVDALLAHSADPLGLVSAAVADVYVLKPGALGGLTAAATLGFAAVDRGKKAVVTSFLDGAIGLAGSVALAAAMPGGDVAAGLATSYLFAGNVAEPPPIADGWIEVPAGPGLGVAPQRADQKRTWKRKERT